MVKFLGTATRRFKRLGSHSKKKQKWRRARGNDSKIRQRRKNRQDKVQIGYRTEKKGRYKIQGKIPVFVRNFNDIEKVKKDDVVIIAKIGRRKKIEIEKRIKEIGGNII